GAPHAAHRARRSPDRSRLGRPVRRRGTRTTSTNQPYQPSQPHSPRTLYSLRTPGGQVTSTLPSKVDPLVIRDVMDGRWAHVRRDARENLRDPDFAPVYGETVQEARDRVTRMAKKLADSGRVGLGFPKQYG